MKLPSKPTCKGFKWAKERQWKECLWADKNGKALNGCTNSCPENSFFPDTWGVNNLCPGGHQWKKVSRPLPSLTLQSARWTRAREGLQPHTPPSLPSSKCRLQNRLPISWLLPYGHIAATPTFLRRHHPILAKIKGYTLIRQRSIWAAKSKYSLVFHPSHTPGILRFSRAKKQIAVLATCPA